MIHEAVRNASSIALFTHINPDGDALGSTFGMAGFLTDLGKDVTICLTCEPSESLRFMIPPALKENILVWDDGKADAIRSRLSACDLFIGLDFNTLERAGSFGPVIRETNTRKILVDHHVGPDRETFHTVYSETEISSACELVFKILMQDSAIGGDCSRMNEITRYALLTGMTTDTNNFANSVYPSTLEMASKLIAAGTDRNRIIDALYFNYPLRRLQAQGYLLDNLLKITPEGLAYMIVDRQLQEKFDLREGDTEGFVNIPLSVAQVRISVMLKEEMTGNKIRVSVRSKKGTSARDFAMTYFHGGGHEQASGGKLMKGEDLGGIEEAAAYIEQASHKFFMESADAE